MREEARLLGIIAKQQKRIEELEKVKDAAAKLIDMRVPTPAPYNLAGSDMAAIPYWDALEKALQKDI